MLVRALENILSSRIVSLKIEPSRIRMSQLYAIMSRSEYTYNCTFLDPVIVRF